MSTVLKITYKDEVLRARFETLPAYANYVSEMRRLFPAATLAAATFKDCTGQLKHLSASTWEDFLATGTLSASGSMLLKLDVQGALPVDAEAEPGPGDGIPSLLEMEERAEDASCLRGKRIAMMPRGSRGDVQPFVALGSRLRAAGCRVLVLTNADHLDFVAEFGLEAVGVAPDCRKDHEAPEFQHALATGNWVPFMAVKGWRTLTELPGMLAKELDALREFGPDLVYATPLSWTRARVFSRLLAVPMVNGSLQPIEEDQPRQAETKQFDQAWLTSQAELQVIRSVLGKDSRFDATWTSHRSCRLDFLEPLGPTFVHWSPVLNEVPLHKRDRHVMTGFLVVGQQEQEQCFEGQRDSIFGGEAASELRDFLESGAPPVYLGWGSMVIVSREHMACLAVRALRRAGLRGVILGGWAGLTADLLPGDLRKYASTNVLFTKSAPHEWLFPRCAVTVHHGGAGTTAAALRAGVPTVITPCGIDQPGIAQRVQASGCGLALGHFPQVTPKQLAEALTRCLGDEAMKAQCRCMGEFLREEDGVGITVSEIERFMREEVHTGAWQARHEERLQHEQQEHGSERRSTQCPTQ